MLALNASTVGAFTSVRNASFSSRALGWDTNLHSVDDFGFDGVCGGGSKSGSGSGSAGSNEHQASASLLPASDSDSYFPESTFLHIGYTGTCVCIAPPNADDGGVWTVLLTNRVYGCQGQLCPSASEDAAKAAYRQFNEAAARLYYPLRKEGIKG